MYVTVEKHHGIIIFLLKPFGFTRFSVVTLYLLSCYINTKGMEVFPDGMNKGPTVSLRYDE